MRLRVTYEVEFPSPGIVLPEGATDLTVEMVKPDPTPPDAPTISTTCFICGEPVHLDINPYSGSYGWEHDTYRPGRMHDARV